jgi:hypothetical protein
MTGQHLLEQWALDENVPAQIKWGVAQHLVDRFALVFTHPVLVLGFGSSGAKHRAEENECRRIMYAISLLSAAPAARAVRVEDADQPGNRIRRGSTTHITGAEARHERPLQEDSP